MGKRVPRTESELLAASGHLYFEIRQLSYCASRLRLPQDYDRALQNALLTAFAVSYRNVYFFFYPDGKVLRPDNIIAADYFSGAYDWTSIRPSATDFLETTYKMVHVHAAHLSYDRLLDESPYWNWREITTQLTPTISAFVHALRPVKLHPRLTDFDDWWIKWD